MVYRMGVWLTTVPLPGGAASAPATLDVMRSWVLRSLQERPVWEAARNALAGVGADPTARAAALASWLRGRFHYTPDPLDLELLTDPTTHARAILRHGITFGDCDDAAALGAALGIAAGLPAKLVAVAYRPRAPLSHVYAALRTPNGWAILDPTIPPQGPAPTPRRRMEISI